MDTYYFSNILRRTLLESKTSPQHLADFVGANILTINKWLSGKSIPNSVSLSKVILLFKNNLYELLESCLYQKYIRATNKYENLRPFSLEESFGFLIGDIANSKKGLDKISIKEIINKFEELRKQRNVQSFEDRLQFENEEPKSLIYTLPAPAISLINNWNSIINQIKSDHNYLYQLDWKKFEDLMAHLLAKNGWEVEQMGYTKDEGIDILALRRVSPGVKFTMMVQCKRNNEERKVGVSVVKNVWATKWEKGIHHAMIATTSFFTKGAISKADIWNMDLRDHNAIIELCNNYGLLIK
jgi:hypothetical protein